jgi:hypothetical protein
MISYLFHLYPTNTTIIEGSEDNKFHSARSKQILK